MNLILAVVWFALGVGVLGWEFYTGKRSYRLEFLGGISPAWLAFPMCLYNLVRWYSERACRRSQEALQLSQAHRSRLDRERISREREPGGEIDPTFDFTSDKPQPPTRPNITDQPPSMN